MAQPPKSRGTPGAKGGGTDAPDPPPKAGASTGTEECVEDDYDEHSRWAAEMWPEIEEAVESIVTRIDMAQRHFERAAVDTRDQVGLSHGELKVLLRLSRGPRNQSELAKHLMVSTGTMTNQLDKLEGAGLVVRHPDPADRRGKVVEMTEKGREVLDTYINIQAGRERDLVGGLNDREKRDLNALLRKLLASLRE